jgi:hypothetical protein
MIFNDYIKTGCKIQIKDGKKNLSGLMKEWISLKESHYNGEDNFMILTGQQNRITVIDLDVPKEDEINGIEWFETNICKISDINTLTTKTIRGGYHIYFNYTDELKTITKLNGMSLDILNNNKGVLEGKNYTILNDLQVRSFTETELKFFKPILKEETLSVNKIDLKATQFFNKPEGTSWAVVRLNNGYKIVPNCRQCLIDPTKEHSHDEHSALFINDNKSVTKSCYSCGTEVLNKTDSKKVMTIFNVIIKTQEDSLYQSLVKDLIKYANDNHYKREKNTGIVYKQVKSYAYTKYLEPMDFLNEIFIDDYEFKSHVNNMDNMIKFMKQYNDTDFGFLEYNEDYIGFNNGVLNIITCEFTDIPEHSLVVKKYIDNEFNSSLETPILDKILNYQFKDDIRDFIYMCLGRMFKIRDEFGFMLYLLGEPGCGKSLVLDVLCECFDNIGSIGNTFEEKFGLSFLYDKDIVICDDLPKNISKIFPQQVFQTVITGGKVSIAVKGGNAFTIDWKVPMIWAGNWFADYIDKGQISRRMLVANFEKNVNNPDPTLKKQIIQNELPAFIYKCLTYYKTLIDSNSKKDIWGICPEYFLEQQQELKIERNPLYKFLLENTEYKQGNMITIEEIRKEFSDWIGKKISKLDNGTFGQVNREFIIETLMICKSCLKEHKKGCCDNYNRISRTNKKFIKNINIIKKEDF